MDAWIFRFFRIPWILRNFRREIESSLFLKLSLVYSFSELFEIKEEKMKKINFKVLIISFVVIYLVAFVGSLFTSPNTGSDWYVNNRPDITPPNYVFPIVWNILFFMIALSLYFAWMNAKKKQKKNLAIVFGANLILNALWSFLFFGLKQPLWAFVELVFLWITILAMIYTTWKIDKKSAYLLIPYLLWVSFAGVLNLGWIF